MLRSETEAVCNHFIIAAWRRGYDDMFRSVVIKTEKKIINPGHLTVAGEAIEISVVVILFTLDIKFADRHIRKIKGTREKANGFVAVQ